MFNHILIGTDGSQLARKAEIAGLNLAKELNAQVTIVTVTEPLDAMAALTERSLPDPMANYDEAVAMAAHRILSSVRQVANEIGVDCATVHSKDKHPAEGVLETARARGCDLIVMASHGRRGISRMLLGSQTSEVAALSRIPVLVCR
jgi:nucleotide-binding universal stress UspA family protein